MDKKGENKKSFKLKKQVFIYLSVFFLIIFFMSLYKLTMKLIEDNNSTNKIYGNTSSVKYNVHIKDNDFINEEFLPEDRAYITSISDYVDMDLSYNYNGSLSLPLTYSYSVNISLYGQYNQSVNSDRNPILWEKNYVIKSETEQIKTNDKKININEHIRINVKDYIKEIFNFIEHFQIPTVAYIDISMPIHLYGGNNQYSLEKTYEVSARILIEDKVYKINVNDGMPAVETYKLIKQDNSIMASKEVLINLLVIVVSLIIVLLTYNRAKQSITYENYSKKLEKLKVNYDEVIVLTNNMIDLKDLKKISITSFEELLNLSSNLDLPIMLYEKEREAYFYIIKSEIVYNYVLKNDEYRSKE